MGSSYQFSSCFSAIFVILIFVQECESLCMVMHKAPMCPNYDLLKDFSIPLFKSLENTDLKCSKYVSALECVLSPDLVKGCDEKLTLTFRSHNLTVAELCGKNKDLYDESIPCTERARLKMSMCLRPLADPESYKSNVCGVFSSVPVCVSKELAKIAPYCSLQQAHLMGRYFSIFLQLSLQSFHCPELIIPPIEATNKTTDSTIPTERSSTTQYSLQETTPDAPLDRNEPIPSSEERNSPHQSPSQIGNQAPSSTSSDPNLTQTLRDTSNTATTNPESVSSPINIAKGMSPGRERANADIDQQNITMSTHWSLSTETSTLEEISPRPEGASVELTQETTSHSDEEISSETNTLRVQKFTNNSGHKYQMSFVKNIVLFTMLKVLTTF